MKKLLLCSALLFSASTLALSQEAREQHRGNWSLLNFMTPSADASYFWQNLGEVMPTAVISRQGNISPLLSGEASDISETQYKTSQLKDYLQGENAPVQALMVLEKGKVTFEHFNIDKNQKHVWMSNAKVIAGLLVAMLEEEGRIDVQKTLLTYIPAVKGSAWQDIKVIDVLNMQSGLDLEEHDQARYNPESYVSQFFYSEVNGQDYLKNMLKIPALKAPGEVFEYSSVNTQMLGLLISEVTGQRLSEVIEQRIWSKAGMTGDSVLALSPTGYEIIHGVFASNLEDMARFGLLFTPSWHKTAEQRVISEQVLKTMQNSITKGIYNKGISGPRFVDITGEKPVGAAYQWDKIWSDGDMYKSGMRGQGLYVSPNKDTVIVWFSQYKGDIDIAAFARTYAKSQR